jgi:hypothetical protein
MNARGVSTPLVFYCIVSNIRVSDMAYYRHLFILSCMIVAFVLQQESCAQSWLYPETIVNFDPLLEGKNSGREGMLREMFFWGEFGQFVAARDEDHRWLITVGGAAELYGTPSWNVLFETYAHLNVDPDNNISFNPRALIWEEALFFGYKHGMNSLYIGYAHRCKHDVDNFELYQVSGREESRALIFGSAVLRWVRKKYLISAIQFRQSAEAHVYVFLQDQRFPVASRSNLPNIENMQTAFRFSMDASTPCSEDMSVALRADIRITTLGKDPAHRFSSLHDVWVEPALEAAWILHGIAGDLQIFGRYVYQEDSFITPQAKSAELFALGIRITP